MKNLNDIIKHLEYGYGMTTGEMLKLKDDLVSLRYCIVEALKAANPENKPWHCPKFADLADAIGFENIQRKKSIQDKREEISKLLWEDGGKSAHTHYDFAIHLGYSEKEAEEMFPKGKYF